MELRKFGVCPDVITASRKCIGACSVERKNIFRSYGQYREGKYL
jgi:hypothetical protein